MPDRSVLPSPELTDSTDQERMERELLIHAPLEEVVLSYASNAAAAGLDGVVCSPLEAGAIHRRCGASFLTVTPGVRFAGGDAGDQKRVTTPAKARELGSDYIVVGRPITHGTERGDRRTGEGSGSLFPRSGRAVRGERFSDGAGRRIAVGSDRQGT